MLLHTHARAVAGASSLANDVLNTYYADGGIKSSEERNRHQQLLRKTEYYQNGMVKSEQSFKDGQLEREKSYYRTGILEAETQHTESKGKASDLRRTYHPNGALKAEWAYEEGQLVSVKSYDQNGALTDERRLKPGETDLYYGVYKPPSQASGFIVSGEEDQKKFLDIGS
jgi:antitoxin component YwqK of YwqJK toxin-antitoxin module